MEPRKHAATHSLDGNLWLHVSNSNGAQKAHSNSQTGWNFIAACQQFKWSPGGTQQLTPWMEFHGCMSDGAQEAHSNSQPGWNFMAVCQPFKWSPGGTQQLTSWMAFHGCMSAIQMEPGRHTATHILDGISWLYVSHSNGAQEMHNSHSRHWINHFCCQFKILYLTFLLPSICYVQNFLSYHFEFLTFPPLSPAYSVYCQMCLMSHPHTVIQVKLCYQHWIMILTSWNICCHHLPWPRQK